VANPTIKKFDSITNDNFPIITGTGEPGAIIWILANGQELNGLTTVCMNGSWEFMNESFLQMAIINFKLDRIVNEL
jgi:hypothetical protein